MKKKFITAKVRCSFLWEYVMVRYEWLQVLIARNFSLPLHQIMKNFTLQTYGRTELAQLYSPHITPHAAWRRLRAWIALNPVLNEKLAATGYSQQQRVFTPAQVAHIIDELGEP